MKMKIKKVAKKQLKIKLKLKISSIAEVPTKKNFF